MRLGVPFSFKLCRRYLKIGQKSETAVVGVGGQEALFAGEILVFLYFETAVVGVGDREGLVVGGTCS